jgi:molybdate transport system permease protein
VLGFAKSMGEFGATITFVSNIPGQTQTIPSAIFEFLQLPGNNFMTVRLVCLSLFISIGALYISEVLASRLSRREQN